MRGIRRRLKNRFEKYCKGTKKKHCGKCVESGHSICTCAEMKAVSAARLKEVLAYGKAQSLPSSALSEMMDRINTRLRAIMKSRGYGDHSQEICAWSARSLGRCAKLRAESRRQRMNRHGTIHFLRAL
jgi:hypothetical protein